MRLVCGKTESETANYLMRCPNWVAKWVDRYREGGIDALRDRPRTGRPPIIPKKDLDEFMTRKENAKVVPSEIKSKMCLVTTTT